MRKEEAYKKMLGKKGWVNDPIYRVGEIVLLENKMYEVKDIIILPDEGKDYEFNRDYILVEVDKPYKERTIRVRNAKKLPLFCKKE